MKNEKKNNISVDSIKSTIEALDRLAKDNGEAKDGKTILEDTASLMLDIPSTLRILGFQIKCKVKMRWNIFLFKVKGILDVFRTGF